MTIADEVSAALAEAGTEISGAPLVVTVTRKAEVSPQGNPFAEDNPAPSAPAEYSFNAFDMGWVNEYSEGSLVPVSVHKLMVEKGEVTILNSDTVTISGAEHEISKVKPFAPFGGVIYQEVHLKT